MELKKTNLGVSVVFEGGPFEGEKRMVHDDLFRKGVIVVHKHIPHSLYKEPPGPVVSESVVPYYRIRLENGVPVERDGSVVFEWVGD